MGDRAKSKGGLKLPVIETVELERLRPWDKNPRKNHAVAAIERSIKEFGYLAPIIVQKGTYRILAGHGRLAALKKRGVRKVPVMVADLSDEKADLFTLTDNKLAELGQWDDAALSQLVGELEAKHADLGLAGFERSEIDDLLDDAEAEGSLKDVDVKPPPKMTWVLVGIPTVRYGEIAADMEKLATVEGIKIETTSNDGD